MRTIVSIFSFFFFFLTITIQSSGQELNTIEMEYNGEIVEVTKDIDPEYWGVYTKGGKNKWQYVLHVNGESYFLKETLVDPLSLEYSFEYANKELIDWGLLVKDGKIVTEQVDEYVDGRMKSYEAMVFIYKNHKTGEVADLYLYQENGHMTLGYAQKITDLVNNR